MKNTITRTKFTHLLFEISLVRTFQWLWRAVAENLEGYSGFPRLVGECGGKNYHFVHPSAHVPTVVAATIRSAFEYQVRRGPYTK